MAMKVFKKSMQKLNFFTDKNIYHQDWKGHCVML